MSHLPCLFLHNLTNVYLTTNNALFDSVGGAGGGGYLPYSVLPYDHHSRVRQARLLDGTPFHAPKERRQKGEHQKIMEGLADQGGGGQRRNTRTEFKEEISGWENREIASKGARACVGLSSSATLRGFYRFSSMKSAAKLAHDLCFTTLKHEEKNLTGDRNHRDTRGRGRFGHT